MIDGIPNTNNNNNNNNIDTNDMTPNGLSNGLQWFQNTGKMEDDSDRGINDISIITQFQDRGRGGNGNNDINNNNTGSNCRCVRYGRR